MTNSMDSRAKLAQRMSNKLPKADTIKMKERELSEERKKIHVVKHLPRTDEEILDAFLVETTAEHKSMRKAQKDAKSRLEKKKQKLTQREAKQANASEVSEVETVIQNNALFSVDVNLDNLNDHLGQLRNILQNQDAHLQQLEH